MDLREAQSELESLAERLAATTGIRLPSGARGVLADAVEERAGHLFEGDIAAYANATSVDTDELYLLYDRISVGQTEFFRGGSFFDVFHRDVVPEAARRAAGTLRIWSAGCSTGEEPWTLAAVCADALGPNADVDIWATDWSRPALAAAETARYRRAARDQIPPQFRYLFHETDALTPAPSLRRMVNFARHNLIAPVPKPSDTFDVVLLCNVLIYFDAPVVAEVIATVRDALRPGGLLCLGRAESLWGLEHDFDVVDVGHGFAYRRPLERPSSRISAPPSTPAPPARVRAHTTRDDAAHLETQITERVAGTQGLLNVGRVEAAADAAAALTTDHPLDPRGHYLLGATLERRGEREYAFAAYGRSIYVDADFVLSHLCRAGILEARGERRRAAAAYAAAHDAFARGDATRFEVFLETLSTESLGRLCAEKAHLV